MTELDTEEQRQLAAGGAAEAKARLAERAWLLHLQRFADYLGKGSDWAIPKTFSQKVRLDVLTQLELAHHALDDYAAAVRRKNGEQGEEEQFWDIALDFDKIRTFVERCSKRWTKPEHRIVAAHFLEQLAMETRNTEEERRLLEEGKPRLAREGEAHGE
jgi:hypothetical protein